MEIKRKLKDVRSKEYLEEKMEDAEVYNYEFIELRFGRNSQYKEKIIGLDTFELIQQRKAGDQFSTTAGVKIVGDGTVHFYPDTRNVCWGYMLDTDRNRKWLAAQLKNRMVVIVDKTVNKQIHELAKTLGFATEIVVADKTFDNYLKKSEVKKEDIEANEEIERLRQELAELKAAAEVKPLAGKKITKKKSE